MNSNQTVSESISLQYQLRLPKYISRRESRQQLLLIVGRGLSYLTHSWSIDTFIQVDYPYVDQCKFS